MKSRQGLKYRNHPAEGIVDFVAHGAHDLGEYGCFGFKNFIGKTFDKKERAPETSVHEEQSRAAQYLYG